MPSDHQQGTMNSTQSEAQSFFNKGQGTVTSIEPEERSFSLRQYLKYDEVHRSSPALGQPVNRETDHADTG